MSERRIYSLDIEVLPNYEEALSKTVMTGSMPIQMIGGYDWRKNRFYSFFFHEKVKLLKREQMTEKNRILHDSIRRVTRRKDFNVFDFPFISPESDIKYECTYIFTNSEKTMLRLFLNSIKSLEIDIFHGFFIKTFDLVYIINRCKTLEMSANYLSPLHQVYVSHGNATIRGAIIYDIPDLYSHYMGTHRHANSLKKISESHLQMSKTSESIIGESWYDDNTQKFVEYCLVDVELCVLLENKLKMLESAQSDEFFTGVNPLFFNMRSHLFESFASFLKPLYEKEILDDKYKIVFNTKQYQDYKRAYGALVLPSVKGLYAKGMVIILDLSKMYPKIIESLNISIETLVEIIDDTLKHLYNHAIANDQYYIKEPIGFIPFVLKFLYELRDRVEERMERYEYGSPEYNDMKKVKQSVKMSVNAVTGQFDYANSIVLKEECANSTRLTGRMEITKARDYSIKFSMVLKIMIKVIYGDTDSLFLWLRDVEDVKVAIKIGEEICKWIQIGFDAFAREMNVENHQFKIGMEKVCDVFFLTDKKKKYFAHVRWVDGHYISEENSLYVMGFESRRTDNSELTLKVQEDLFKLINSTKEIGFSRVKRKIINLAKSGYANEFDEENWLFIGIPRKISKPFREYKVTSPHLRGCKYANKYLNANFRSGSKPKLTYIKKVNVELAEELGYGKLPQTDVICVEEGMVIPKDVFIIDKEKMIEKTVFDKMKKTLEVLDIDKSEILTNKKQDKLDKFMKKTVNKFDFSIDKEKLITDRKLSSIFRKSKIELNKLENWLIKKYKLKKELNEWIIRRK